MLTVTSAELNLWMATFLWPLSRTLGLVAAAPLFGNAGVPLQLKIVLGFLLAMVISPVIPPMPSHDPASWAGLLIVAREMLVGVAMGFAMRVVFAAVEMAGEAIGLTMGLGFATFYDPQTHGRSSTISQFLTLFSTLVLLAIDGHLMMIEVLAESFVSLPVAATPLPNGATLEVARWGGVIFSSGLQLALPVLAALLMTNVALGVLTRAAPQLNLFGIGFPVSIGVGFLLIALALPYLGGPLQALFNQGFGAMRDVFLP